jgi:hypothetical protein
MNELYNKIIEEDISRLLASLEVDPIRPPDPWSLGSQERLYIGDDLLEIEQEWRPIKRNVKVIPEVAKKAKADKEAIKHDSDYSEDLDPAGGDDKDLTGSKRGRCVLM